MGRQGTRWNRRYFDYIAGTSTGAIIATALSLGKTVEEITALYQTLGATLLATMATQLEYELCWPAGEDNLLLVSVGTGIAPVTAPTRKNVLAAAFKLPGVFMNGASIGQDYLCRVAGTTRFGPQFADFV